MSDLLSFLSEIFNKEFFFLLRGLSKQDADGPLAIQRRNPTSGIPRQLVALVFCWAVLKYLNVKIDWQTVRRS
jgi:hypothetical protein